MVLDTGFLHDKKHMLLAIAQTCWKRDLLCLTNSFYCTGIAYLDQVQKERYWNADADWRERYRGVWRRLD